MISKIIIVYIYQKLLLHIIYKYNNLLFYNFLNSKKFAKIVSNKWY